MFYFRLNRILCWQYFALNLLLMQRKHRDAKTSFIFINICLIYCGVSKTNLFTLYCCQCHITYSISVGFPTNLSFYDVFEWHSRILQRNFLLGLSFELLQNQGFAMKADKSISSTMINFILNVWVYSSLHLQIRIPFVVSKYLQLYFTYCTYENHFHLVLNCV